ncbi:MAG: ROK family transcriptional regulator [Pseudonocardia sp.]|nr:ROK family transcriptional regulator [Pseudonocardia sp.]
MSRSRPSVDRPGSQSALKSANQQRLLNLLLVNGELTQAEIARRSGLAPATVSNIVRELVDHGVLVGTDGTRPRGRVVRLARASGVAVGVDFGYQHITTAVADLSHTILSTRRVVLDVGRDARGAVDCARQLIEEVLEEADTGWDDVVGIGAGLPSPIDSRTRKLGAPSLLPGWEGLDVDEFISHAIGRDVAVENDANLGALAEHVWGAGRGYDNMAYLKLSEGVGAGLVLDGKLFHGGRAGTAGEIGHTTVDEYGAVCRCGNRGCLETLVAARAVVSLLEPVCGAGLTIADIVERAERGDAACRRVLADTGRQTGVALANLCNLLNPERVIIGGELAVAGELLLQPMREIVRRYAIPSAVATLDLVLGSLGPSAPVLGAVALALHGQAQLINS